MATIVDNPKVTRQQTVHTRPARHTAQPSPTIIILPHPRRSPGGLRLMPNVTPSPLPMGQRGMRAARAAKNLSVRSPMVAAVLCASFAVSLLCLYVSAYARVNAERLELSRLRQDLKAAKKQELSLNGEISRYHLSAPTRAQAMGLMPAPPDAVQVLTEVKLSATTNAGPIRPSDD